MKRLQQYTALKVAVKWGAKVMPHRPRQENSAGRLDFFRHIPGHSNRDGRDTAGLNRALDQSDRLMADRSSGDQQSCIGFLFHRNRVGEPRARPCAQTSPDPCCNR